MYPEEGELLAMATLDDAAAWVGIDGMMMQSLREAAGNFMLFRHVAAIPPQAWDEALVALRVITVQTRPAVP